MMACTFSRILARRKLISSTFTLYQSISAHAIYLPYKNCKRSDLSVPNTHTYLSINQFPCVGFSTASDAHGPSIIDYGSQISESDFHKLADGTINNLLEKIEEYGETIEIEGFDIDYGNQVLTLKLGDLGTYVLNKQAPNRQIWLSSPVSGPSRYDWDGPLQSWIYRRTKDNLVTLLESELKDLCGRPICLSK